MTKYFLTNKTLQDLLRIWEYAYKVWLENQADKHYELLIESCRDFSKRPEIGKSFEEVSLEISGFHVGKHIFFNQKITPKEIEVVRILHGQMDLKHTIEE